jgi:hypothetical protein
VCLCVFIIIWTLLVFICYLRKWLFCCCRFTLCFSLVDKEKWDSQNGIHHILKRKDPRYYLSLIHIKSVYFIIMHVVIPSIVGFDITWRGYCFVAESVHFVFRVNFKMHVESQELINMNNDFGDIWDKYDKPNNKRKIDIEFHVFGYVFVCTVTKYHPAVNLKFAIVTSIFLCFKMQEKSNLVLICVISFSHVKMLCHCEFIKLQIKAYHMWPCGGTVFLSYSNKHLLIRIKLTLKLFIITSGSDRHSRDRLCDSHFLFY